MRKSVLSKCYSLVFFGLAMASQASANNQVNPAHVYLLNGKPVSGWSLTLGDAANWSVPVNNQQGQSEGRKVVATQVDFNEQHKALSLSWDGRKKEYGSVGIFGAPIDLAAYKDAASLVLDIRVDRKPDKAVSIGMDCGYPCQGKLNIQRMLQKAPAKQWFSLPIPLNCIKGDNFDLSKINAPLTLGTDGRLEISILNVRLEKLQEGEESCKE